MYVLTSALGGYADASRVWPQVRQRAGCDITWGIFIDGSPVFDGKPVVSPEERQQLVDLAMKYADCVVVPPDENMGVGYGIQSARDKTGCKSGHIKLDSDILPSPGFAQGFLDTESEWQDGKLGWLCALKYPYSPRWDVGPRKMLPHQRLPSGLSYITDIGAQALDDHTTKEPINQHDRHISHAMNRAGLWFAYTHRVWMAEHNWNPDDTTYLQWKKQYFGRRASKDNST